MGKEFQQYTLEDFLEDADFCGWARSERPDLYGVYRDLLGRYPKQKDVFQKAARLVNLFEDEKLKTDPARKLQIWEEINRIYRQQKKSVGYKQLFRYAALLAVLFTTAALAWYFILSGNRNELTSWPVRDYAEIRLMLDDGREIDIPSEGAEVVYSRGGDQINVNGKSVPQGRETKNPGLNQLIVPFGRQVKVVLADSTEVWLNAGSRLVYPSQFAENKRKVQLQGEAFFKVSKDKTRPFTVETSHSALKVLGTSFNLRAYPDEKTEETVLVEGSVSIHIGKSFFGEDVLLKPDQRIIAGYPDRSYSILEVDVHNYTSWTDGSLVFKEEPLSRVLGRIARFYNVRISCEDADENRKITGKLDLKQDYLRVLNALELISQGNYTEKNGTITFKLNESNDQ